MSMNEKEAASLLAMAASFDNRTFNQSTIRSWAKMLDGLDFADCMDAIERHYGRVDDWVTPAKIRELVKARAAQIAEDKWAADLRKSLPPHDPNLNRYGKALVLAAAAEAKQIRDARARGEVLLPARPIAEMLDHHPEWSVIEMCDRLGIRPAAPSGDPVVEAIRQMVLPTPDDVPDNLRAARHRAAAEKTANSRT